MRKCEPKEKVVAYAKQELYHNCFWNATGVSSGLLIVMNGGTMPVQGVADNQRVGDQINSTGYKIKMLIGQKGDRPNVTFRYMAFKVPKNTVLSYDNFFKNITGNILLDEHNQDIVTVLKTGEWRPNEAGLAATGNDEFTFVKKLWVPYKRLIKFGPADAAVTHNDGDIYFWLGAYDAYGSSITDNIAYVQTQIGFHYRDL